MSDGYTHVSTPGGRSAPGVWDASVSRKTYRELHRYKEKVCFLRVIGSVLRYGQHLDEVAFQRVDVAIEVGLVRAGKTQPDRAICEKVWQRWPGRRPCTHLSKSRYTQDDLRRVDTPCDKPKQCKRVSYPARMGWPLGGLSLAAAAHYDASGN
jgi:hypothetical protein